MTARAWWPLSLSQEAHLISDEVGRDTNRRPLPTHFPVAMRIRGELDIRALEDAVNTVVQRHSGLTASYLPTAAYGERDRRLMLAVFARSRIFIPGLLFGQRMCPDVRVRIEHRIADPMAHGPLDEEQLAQAAQEEANRPLPLDVAPTMRASVNTFDRDNHLLVLTVSHLAVDGWSAGILREEVMGCIRHISRGNP